nr:hypothetical protein Iba_chr03bCG2300 [Ipomoea batatas]
MSVSQPPTVHRGYRRGSLLHIRNGAVGGVLVFGFDAVNWVLVVDGSDGLSISEATISFNDDLTPPVSAEGDSDSFHSKSITFQFRHVSKSDIGHPLRSVAENVAITFLFLPCNHYNNRV